MQVAKRLKINGFAESLLDYLEPPVKSSSPPLQHDVVIPNGTMEPKEEPISPVLNSAKPNLDKAPITNGIVQNGVNKLPKISEEIIRPVLELGLCLKGHHILVTDFQVLNRILRQPKTEADKIVEKISALMEKEILTLRSIRKYESAEKRSRFAGENLTQKQVKLLATLDRCVEGRPSMNENFDMGCQVKVD